MTLEKDSSKETNWRRSKRQNGEEPELDIVDISDIKSINLTSYQVTHEFNIYPTCEDGEIFYCEENESYESLDKNCGEILMFNSETSSCYCRGSNRRKRNILKQGWSKYSR